MWHSVDYRLIGTYKILKKIHEFIQSLPREEAMEKRLLEFLDRYHHYNEHSLDDVNGYFVSSSIDKWQVLRIETQEQDNDSFLELLSDRYPTLRIIYYKENDETHEYITNDWTGKYFPAKSLDIVDGKKIWYNDLSGEFKIQFDDE